MNENVLKETPMLTGETTTVTNKEDACALPVTVNAKNQEDIHLRNEIVALCIFQFWNHLPYRIMNVLLQIL